MEQRIEVTIEAGVADVRLVRADKMNALDEHMFEALRSTGQRLIHERGVRAVVLSGEGRSFRARHAMGQFRKMALATVATGSC